MSSRIQEDSGQLINYNRLPLRWQSTGAGHRYSVMGWKVAWPAPISAQLAIKVLACVQALMAGSRNRVGDVPFPQHTLEADACNALDRATREAAIGFQCGGSPALSAWIAAVSDGDEFIGFSYPFLDEVFAHEAGIAAIRLVGELAGQNHLLNHENQQQAEQLVVRIQTSLKAHHPPNNSMLILAEAQRRGIPFCRISRQLPAYQLGHGFRQRRFWRGFTSATSHLGTVLATQKPLTNDLLRQSGLPVPDQYVVTNLEAALIAAQRIGWPVVVKPTNTDFGIAVTADIHDPAGLRDAFDRAQAHGAVVVERHIEGVMHRLGVIDGNCLWVARTMAPQCEGDGKHSVAEFAAMINEKRRHDTTLHGFAGIDVGDPQVLDTLARQRLRVEDVPPRGTKIIFRPHANVSTGATREIVTATTHPDNLRLAERAAAAVGLDVAGIDFITPDITRSWLDVGGGICEVNPMPGMPDQEAPSWLLDYMFPNNAKGRIPVFLVIGDLQSEQFVHAELIQTACRLGYAVGAVRDHAAFLNNQQITAVPTTLDRGLRIVFATPLVAAVCIYLSPDNPSSVALELEHIDLAIVWLTAQQHSDLSDQVLKLLQNAEDVLYLPPVQVAVDRCQELLERYFSG